MLQRTSSPLRYSLEGFLKRLLYVHGGPMKEADIIQSVKDHWFTDGEKSKEKITERVQKILSTGPFAQKEGGYVLQEAIHDEWHDIAYQFLAQGNMPQKQGEILRYLQQMTKRSRGELMSRIDFDADGRFARLESGEWVLTEWQLINDEEEQIVMKEMEGQPMNGNQDLVTTILSQMASYLKQLEERNRQIPEEVMRYFHMDDLKGIEQLMQERKRNVDFFNDLQELMKKWNVLVEDKVHV